MSTSPSSLVDNLFESYSKRCRDKNCCFAETLLPDKKNFLQWIVSGDITDEDYTHTQSVSEIYIKKPWWLSWLVCLKWCIVACRCVWKL